MSSPILPASSGQYVAKQTVSLIESCDSCIESNIGSRSLVINDNGPSVTKHQREAAIANQDLLAKIEMLTKPLTAHGLQNLKLEAAGHCISKAKLDQIDITENTSNSFPSALTRTNSTFLSADCVWQVLHPEYPQRSTPPLEFSAFPFLRTIDVSPNNSFNYQHDTYELASNTSVSPTTSTIDSPMPSQ